jgi:hypothetical protein
MAYLPVLLEMLERTARRVDGNVIEVRKLSKASAKTSSKTCTPHAYSE